MWCSSCNSISLLYVKRDKKEQFALRIASRVYRSSRVIVEFNLVPKTFKQSGTKSLVHSWWLAPFFFQAHPSMFIASLSLSLRENNGQQQKKKSDCAFYNSISFLGAARTKPSSINVSHINRLSVFSYQLKLFKKNSKDKQFDCMHEILNPLSSRTEHDRIIRLSSSAKNIFFSSNNGLFGCMYETQEYIELVCSCSFLHNHKLYQTV